MPEPDWTDEQRRNGATAPCPYDGRCAKCDVPLDDHRYVGTSRQECPPARRKP